MICIDERIIIKHLESVLKRTANPKYAKKLNEIINNINATKKTSKWLYM